MSEKKRMSCPVKHVNFYITFKDDGTHNVKCVNLKICGDSCPYLKDPNYKSEFKRAPQFRAK